VHILFFDDDCHWFWQYLELDGMCPRLFDRAHEKMDQQQAKRAYLQTFSLHALLCYWFIHTRHTSKICNKNNIYLYDS